MDEHGIVELDLATLSLGQLEALDLMLGSRGVPFERTGHTIRCPVARRTDVEQLATDVGEAVAPTDGLRQGEQAAATRLLRQGAAHLPIPVRIRTLLLAPTELRSAWLTRLLIGGAVFVALMTAAALLRT